MSRSRFEPDCDPIRRFQRRGYRILFALGVLLVASLAPVLSQQRAPAGGERSLELAPEASRLLDRGVGSAERRGAQRTHTSPMATLFHPEGGPSIAALTAGFQGAGSFLGNFFVAPADFPTSYYPFFVTGAFAYVINAQPTLTFAAGVATGPFPAGTMMWADFVSATVAGPPASANGLFGSPGIFPHAPPTVSVPSGMGVACGIRPGMSEPRAGINNSPGLSPHPDFEVFEGSPSPYLRVSPFGFPAVLVAGCYVSGATVPVELQRFTVD